MTVSEFINTYAFATIAALVGKSRPTTKDLEETYSKKLFYLPRLQCKDGFSISIQVHWGAYCASENGTREFGFKWELVEWGYPTEILGKEFNPEEEDTTQTIGGYVDINIIDSLIESHGGLDLIATLKNGIYDVQR